MTKHCPICEASNIIAVGAVAYSTCVLVEHRCMRCGHMFYIDDRRGLSLRHVSSSIAFKDDFSAH